MLPKNLPMWFLMTPGSVRLGPFLLWEALLVTCCLPVMILLGMLLCDRHSGDTVVTRRVMPPLILLPLLLSLISVFMSGGRVGLRPRRHMAMKLLLNCLKWWTLTPLFTSVPVLLSNRRTAPLVLSLRSSNLAILDGSPVVMNVDMLVVTRRKVGAPVMKLAL